MRAWFALLACCLFLAIAPTGTWAHEFLLASQMGGTAADRGSDVTVDADGHQFDPGSGIAFSKLGKAQIRSLTTLGTVWGFLKYHHPAVTSGKHQWDFELFRVLPLVLDARSQGEANAAIARWVASLG